METGVTTAPLSLTEQAFEGTVIHRRRLLFNHSFRYRVWMSLSFLENSKLPKLLRPQELKYIPMSRILELTNQDARDAQVWLLTQPSVVGRSFNPVSFYFVVVSRRICTIVAHITNTPWDEDHCYVLENSDKNTWRFEKDFHVSPFMPMKLGYVWRFRISDERIVIHMQLHDKGKQVFAVVLNLYPSKASVWLPLKLRLKYPAQNLVTFGRIYWQATLLKLKGAHFHAHPDDTPRA